MKIQNSSYLNRMAIIQHLAENVFIVIFLLTALLLPLPVTAEPIGDLRLQQQKDLSDLRDIYHQKVQSVPGLVKEDGSINTSDQEYQQILQNYKKQKQEIQQDYNKQDVRGDEIKKLQETYGENGISLTGSEPKDVRADVDLTAKSSDMAEKVAEDWKGRGDKVKYDPKLGIYINETTDTTLWLPPDKDQLESRGAYHDAFSTPGGKKETGVRGTEAITDPEGYVLDNEKKFIHATDDFNKYSADDSSSKNQLEREMALKTMGKSVNKAAKNARQDSELVKQSEHLRNYKDEFEAGIAALGSSPEKQEQDIKKWTNKADQQLQNSYEVAQKRSKRIKDIRQHLADSVSKSNDEHDTADNIVKRNEMLTKENSDARAANDKAREKAGLAAAPPPGKKVSPQDDDADKTQSPFVKKKGSGETETEIETDSQKQQKKKLKPAWKPSTDKDVKAKDTKKSGMETDSSSAKKSQTKKDSDTASDNKKTSTTKKQVSEDRPKPTSKIDKDGSLIITTTKTNKTKNDQGDITHTSSSDIKIDKHGRVSTTETDTGITKKASSNTTVKKIKITEKTPWKTTTSSEYDKSKRFDGSDDDDKNKEPQTPPKVSVKIAGGNLFDPVNGAEYTSSKSGATKTIGGVEIEAEHKVEVGQHSATGGWDVSVDKEGLKAGVNVAGEANLIKSTTEVKVDKQITENVSAGGKVVLTGKVGAEGKTTAQVAINKDKISAEAGAEVFVGGKADVAAEAQLKVWGVKLIGKGQAEVSFGGGATAKLDAELSWTKIRMGGKLAATLGLGAGGSTSVEIDATQLITGVDMDKVNLQSAAADGLLKVLKDIRDGRLKLPDKKKFSDIRKQLQEKSEWYARHPQKDKQGKPINISDSIAKDLGLKKGKNQAHVVVQKQQKDHYCTNRPVITAPVRIPKIIKSK